MCAYEGGVVQMVGHVVVLLKWGVEGWGGVGVVGREGGGLMY